MNGSRVDFEDDEIMEIRKTRVFVEEFCRNFLSTRI